MMARPVAKPALPKAPTRDHPAAPPPVPPSRLTAAEPPAPAAPAVLSGRVKRGRGRPRKGAGTVKSPLVMFSARIDSTIARRAKLYAARTNRTLQSLTEAALVEYMNRYPPEGAAGGAE